jgi:hypothetical protein
LEAPNNNGPLMGVVEAVYDLTLAISEDSEKGARLQHDFWGEVTRVEVALLQERTGRQLPVYRHPLPAMRTYRAFMCDAKVYDEIGNAKIRVKDRDVIELRYWHCRYARVCAARERKVCLRTHSLAEAAELMSPTTFRRIDSLDFSEEGNCVVQLRVDFQGDLRAIEPEEKIVDESLHCHLGREVADELFLKTMLVGSEYAITHVPGIRPKQTLTDLARRLRRGGAMKGPLAKSAVLKAALEMWESGENAFVKQNGHDGLG